MERFPGEGQWLSAVHRVDPLGKALLYSLGNQKWSKYGGRSQSAHRDP